MGPHRRKALIKAFGSISRLRKATLEEVAAVPGISAELATTIYSALAADRPTPAVNVTTGEVIDEDGSGRQE